jgi:hypothetical protein
MISIERYNELVWYLKLMNFTPPKNFKARGYGISSADFENLLQDLTDDIKRRVKNIGTLKLTSPFSGHFVKFIAKKTERQAAINYFGPRFIFRIDLLYD